MVRTLRLPRSVRGLSLIELMVGVAVGLIGMVAVFRALALWDTQTRTLTAGEDAQVTGTLVMYNVERDLKQAGLGFTADTMAQTMGCTVQAQDGARVFSFPLTPIRITVGAGGLPDRLDILYGNSSRYTYREEFTESTPATKKLRRRNGLQVGDLVVTAQGSSGGPGSAQCALLQVTDVSNADGFTIDHAEGVRFNPAGGSPVAFTSGHLHNLGPDPRLNRWEVTYSAASAPRLSRSDIIHGTPAVEVAPNVVNLKAEYGVDTNADGRITDTTPNEWTTTAPVDPTQLFAVRVAVLVRSKQYERTTEGAPVIVTPNPPTWAGGTFVMRNIDGTPDSYSATDVHPNNWRNYRYRVYERVIPLRNPIWGGES